MAITPSGKIRKMQVQNFRTAQQLFDAGQQRDSVEQTEVKDVQPAPVEPQPVSPPTPTESTPAVKIPEADKSVDLQKDSTMKAYIYNMLEGLGVPKRQLDNIDKQLYSQEINLDDRTISGHYMIPTFTIQGEIDEQKAQSIARQIGEKFNLSQKMKLNGRNWRIDFRSVPKQENHDGGSSFDELQGNLDKKASFTIGEMIKARKDDLYNKLRNLSNGRKDG